MAVAQGSHRAKAGGLQGGGRSPRRLVLRIVLGGAAEQTAQPGRRTGLERDESPAHPQHALTLGEHPVPQLGREGREQTSNCMKDDDVVGTVCKGQHVWRPDVHVGERAGLGERGARGACGCLVADDNGRQAGEARFRRDRSRDPRAVDADLQRALTESHAAHRDRERLDADARLPQKPAHFPMI